MKEIKIITPPVAETDIELCLCKITKRLYKKFDCQDMGGLGGQYGYGYNYENDIFMMHRYCWCEEDNCKWCNGDAPNFVYKPTNTKIWWYKWIGRSQKMDGELPKDWFNKCLNSLK